MAPALERSFVAQPTISAGGRVITSPFQFFTTGEDNLQVVSACSVTGVALKIHLRWVDADGTIKATSYDHTPNSDRSSKTQNYPLGPGAILNLTVFASAGTPSIGQCFVIVRLIRGLSGATIILGTLLQGYVTTVQGLGWPGSPIISSTDGEPFVRELNGTDQVAGVEMSETVPTGARWEILSILSVLTTSATVTTRLVTIQFNMSGSAVAKMPSPLGHDASQTKIYTFGPGSALFIITATDTLTLAIPNRVILRAGDSFQTLTNNFQAGDDWQAPRIAVREWLEVAA